MNCKTLLAFEVHIFNKDRSKPGQGSRTEPAGSWTRLLEAALAASDSPLGLHCLPKPYPSSTPRPLPPCYCPPCSFQHAPPSVGRRKRKVCGCWSQEGHGVELVTQQLEETPYRCDAESRKLSSDTERASQERS